MDRRGFTMGVAAGLARSGHAWAEAGGLDALWRRAGDGSLPATGRADALYVEKDGRLLFEAYGKDHGPHTPHVSWSMAKSITQALTGMAVLDGKVSLDAPLRRAPGLTLRRLLTMTDGLEWNENGYSVVTSDATRMLYGPGRMDGAAYTAAKRQAVAPGSRWAYSTGAIQLAAAEVQDSLFPRAKTPQARRSAMRDWIASRLFGPLGMTDATAEFDPSGTFYGGSLVYASARDYARFGRLYLQDGVFCPKAGLASPAPPPAPPATARAGGWRPRRGRSPPLCSAAPARSTPSPPKAIRDS